MVSRERSEGHLERRVQGVEEGQVSPPVRVKVEPCPAMRSSERREVESMVVLEAV